MYNYKDLVDKIVLVTGASGDIGHAICGKFLEQGCVVYALYCTNKAQLIELQKNHPAGKKTSSPTGGSIESGGCIGHMCTTIQR